MKGIKEQTIALIDEFEGLRSPKMSDYSNIEYPTAELCALVVVKYILKALDPEDYIARDYWLEIENELKEEE
jgi:hypothetical protein